MKQKPGIDIFGDGAGATITLGLTLRHLKVVHHAFVLLMTWRYGLNCIPPKFVC